MTILVAGRPINTRTLLDGGIMAEQKCVMNLARLNGKLEADLTPRAMVFQRIDFGVNYPVIKNLAILGRQTGNDLGIAPALQSFYVSCKFNFVARYWPLLGTR